MQFAFNSTHYAILAALKDHQVYVVGGAVRDAVIGAKCHDIDFAVGMRYEEMEKALLAKKGLIIAPDKTAASHGIARVVDPVGKELIDVATFRKDVATDGRHADTEFTDSLHDDLARRDLTINAMAVPVTSTGVAGALVDPFGGESDLRGGWIRLVGVAEERINEDRLRMLRVCRFATKFNGTIVAETNKAIRKYAAEIHQVSKERVKDEIVKALGYGHAGWMFRHMWLTGLLEHVMPDLHQGVTCMQNKYHKDLVFEHLCYCVDQCKGKKYHPMLKLATLFHDIAKPHTKKVEKGDATFHNHEVVGASIAYKWMKEYRFSNDEIQYVVKMVRHHQWRFMEDTTEKTYRKWLQEVGKHHWRDLVRLRIADRKGNRKKAGFPGMTKEMKDLVRKVRNIINSGQPIFQEDLAINGDDLKIMGLRPGPVYKTIFSNMLGLVITDPAKNTKEWLTNYVKKNFVDKQV